MIGGSLQRSAKPPREHSEGGMPRGFCMEESGDSGRKEERTGKPVVLTRRGEEILYAVYFYRYMTALDVSHLLFSPSSLTYVRKLLTGLAGGGDGVNNQYLYRFALPNASAGNTQRIYTLGNKGRDYLVSEAGLEVDWYFRPQKVKHLSFSSILHNLILTRFLVAAKRWASLQSGVELSKVRTCYELGRVMETEGAGEREKGQREGEGCGYS